jgi:uncharacterized protein YxeA
MKKIHIVLLVVIAIVIAGLLTLTKDITTYDSIASAKKKEGKYVHLIAKLDRSSPVVYDPVKDPNYLSFYAVDSLGARAQVVYRNSKPTELEYKDDPNQQFKEFEKPVATADSTKTY